MKQEGPRSDPQLPTRTLEDGLCCDTINCISIGSNLLLSLSYSSYLEHQCRAVGAGQAGQAMA